MPIYRGSTEILGIHGGASAVQAVYSGSVQVWPSGIWTPSNLFASSNVGEWWTTADARNMYYDEANNGWLAREGEVVRGLAGVRAGETLGNTSSSSDVHKLGSASSKLPGVPYLTAGSDLTSTINTSTMASMDFNSNGFSVWSVVALAAQGLSVPDPAVEIITNSALSVTPHKLYILYGDNRVRSGSSNVYSWPLDLNMFVYVTTYSADGTVVKKYRNNVLGQTSVGISSLTGMRLFMGGARSSTQWFSGGLIDRVITPSEIAELNTWAFSGVPPTNPVPNKTVLYGKGERLGHPAFTSGDVGTLVAGNSTTVAWSTSKNRIYMQGSGTSVPTSFIDVTALSPDINKPIYVKVYWKDYTGGITSVGILPITNAPNTFPNSTLLPWSNGSYTGNILSGPVHFRYDLSPTIDPINTSSIRMLASGGNGGTGSYCYLDAIEIFQYD